MAISQITGAIYSTTGTPYDSKLAPVATYTDLLNVANGKGTQRWTGMTISVLNTDTTHIPCEYQLVGGKTNVCWRIKSPVTVNTVAELDSLPYSACTIGLDAIVKDDNGKVGFYYISSIETDTASADYLKPTWSSKGAFDSSQLSIEMDEGTLELKYGDTVIGSGISFNDLFAEWDYDSYITGGTVVEEEDKTYLVLYRNDANGSLDEDGDAISEVSVRIDVTDLKSSLVSGGTDENALTAITINGSAITIDDRTAEIVLDYQEQIDDLKNKLDQLQVSSAVTTNVTSSTTISYNYIDKVTGEEKQTENEQEAIENSNDDGYTTTETKVETTVVTNTYIQNINVTDLDDFLG